MKLKLVKLFILFVFALAGCQELPPPYNDNEKKLRELPSNYKRTMLFDEWEQMDKRSYLRLDKVIAIYVAKDVDSLPPWLNKFNELKDFNMFYNNHITHFSNIFYEIKSLKYIMISNSKLANIDSAIKSMESLEYIYLPDNQIKTFPEEIYALPHLKEVDFSGNPLENTEEIRRRFEEKGVKVTL